MIDRYIDIYIENKIKEVVHLAIWENLSLSILQKIITEGTGRVGSVVRAVVAYAEDPGSIPASLQYPVTAILGYPVPSELCGYQLFMVHIHMCYENIRIHKIHRTWYRMKVWRLDSFLEIAAVWMLLFSEALYVFAPVLGGGELIPHCCSVPAGRD